nr:LLM class flavin-dependent oxidoreductase [Rhodococcus sp. HNM0569]
MGLTTFAEIDPAAARDGVTPGRRLRELIEEIELADQVGLDVFGVGEHHRADFVASAPPMVLAAAATRTERIALSSAVTVLSSDDPVRVFEQFSTLDLLSNGRAEVMAGRGSFTESFPLFGYDLADYNELFAEKLDLLLKLRDEDAVTWSGTHRAALSHETVYPRPARPLPVWVAVGGNQHSVVRAGLLGLPMALAIIGGQYRAFEPLADLHRRALAEGGHEPQPIAVHAHGYVADTEAKAIEEFYPPYAQAMTGLGRERGWAPMNRGAFDQMRSAPGSLVLGNPEQVAEKIVAMRDTLGLDRFMLHPGVGPVSHAGTMRAIELLGTEVAPLVGGA